MLSKYVSSIFHSHTTEAIKKIKVYINIDKDAKKGKYQVLVNKLKYIESRDSVSFFSVQTIYLFLYENHFRRQSFM